MKGAGDAISILIAVEGVLMMQKKRKASPERAVEWIRELVQ